MTAPALIHNDPLLYDLWRERTRALCDLEGNVRWAVGDALLEAFAAFPKRLTADMADDLGIAPATAYERAAMSSFYDHSARAEFEALGLSYSMLREARKMGHIDAARALLQEALAGAWSVRDMIREVKARKSEYVDTGERVHCVLTFSMRGGHVLCEGLEGLKIEVGVMYEATLIRRAL